MKRFLMFALSAMVLFVACSKDNDNVIDDGKENAPHTSMGLNITFPSLNMTRSADPDNATTSELQVNTVAVFIFNPNGTAATGNGSVLSVALDFDEQQGNIYSLKETSRVKTTSGPKKIYVAANLPATFIPLVTQENVLTQTVTNFGGNLITQLTSTGIGMMSAVNEINLVAMNDADDANEPTPAANKITTDIERMVAKVAVSYASSTTSYIVSDITYAVDLFGVGQDGSAMYPVKWINAAGKLITPFASRTGAPGIGRIKGINPYVSGGKPKDLTNYFYAGENATEEGLRGEAAYASVRAKMTPAKYWKVENDVVVEDTGAPATDAYVVFHDSKYYFTKSEAIAIAVSGALNAANINLPPAGYKLYSGHYCHYFVFLNRKDDATSSRHLELHRNDFINIQVNGVKGIGDPGDPNTGGETPGPEPTDPEIPVVSIPTMIEVTINVTPWNYTDPTVILE